MTVKELIERLQTYPENYEIILELTESREFILDVYKDDAAEYVILTDF